MEVPLEKKEIEEEMDVSKKLDSDDSVQSSTGDSGYGDDLEAGPSVDKTAVSQSIKEEDEATQERREKALTFVKSVMEKVKAYSSYLYKRIQEYSEQEKATPVIKRKGKEEKFEFSEDQPILFTKIGLRAHQIEALKWTRVLYENGLNGILADEMGLGKTAVSIAMIAHLIAMGVEGPFLVCAPLSTISNWALETERFAPEVPYIVYHGTKEERKEKRSQMSSPVSVRGQPCMPMVLTSYEIIMADFKELKNVDWKYIVVDEGHRLKNHKCKLFQMFKQYRMVNCLLLTGTPLQNDLSELWALLNLVLPEVFNDLDGFRNLMDTVMLSSGDADEVIVSEEQKNQLISSIHQILTPFMLRRTKKDVNLKIPPKKEILVYAPMTKLQTKYYCAVLDKTIEDVLKKQAGHVINNADEDDGLHENMSCHANEVEECTPKRKRRKINYAELKETDLSTTCDPVPERVESGDKHKFAVCNLKMANSLMQLRKVCQHPYLLSFPLDIRTQQLLIDENLVKNSGKMMVLDAMLPMLKKRGHKVLLFSQFVIMIEIIADYCTMRNYKFNLLTGQTSFMDRAEQIKEFSNSDSFIFLLSTRAGGLGLNLAAADTVIIFDSDWNPQRDLQAQDRCHRIGQEKPVVVYRFTTKNTVDQVIIEKATTKRKLEKLIIKDGRFSTSDTLTKSQEPVPTDELISVLRSSDIKASVYCNEKEVFTKKELHMLLDRSDLLSNETSPKSSVKELKDVFKVVA